jgi:hypothetical protein
MRIGLATTSRTRLRASPHCAVAAAWKPAQNHLVAEVGTWPTSHQISTLRGRCSSVIRAPDKTILTPVSAPLEGGSLGLVGREDEAPAGQAGLRSTHLSHSGSARSAVRQCGGRRPPLARQGKLGHLLLLRQPGLARPPNYVWSKSARVDGTGLGSAASSCVFSDARVEPRPKRVPRPGRATTRRSPLCPLRAGAEGRGQGARPLLTLCRPSARSIKPGLGSPSGPSPVCRAAFGISSSKPGAAPSLARPPSLPRTSSIVRTGPWRGFPFGSDSRGLS